ncbi:hypothetical protein [Neomesorhizobium albiziae]|uniref:hypothetical protein n=1 Tax=Neomesorhizobium albiziae TaxID=335020 RepID=UPI00122CDD70|nr:hypothetical protein [Mesorhizobium albiziae]
MAVWRGSGTVGYSEGTVLKPFPDIPVPGSHYSSSNADCQLALASAFDALARQAERAGWPIGDVSVSLLMLAYRHLNKNSAGVDTVKIAMERAMKRRLTHH